MLPSKYDKHYKISGTVAYTTKILYLPNPEEITRHTRPWSLADWVITIGLVAGVVGMVIIIFNL